MTVTEQDLSVCTRTGWYLWKGTRGGAHGLAGRWLETGWGMSVRGTPACPRLPQGWWVRTQEPTSSGRGPDSDLGKLLTLTWQDSDIGKLLPSLLLPGAQLPHLPRGRFQLKQSGPVSTPTGSLAASFLSAPICDAKALARERTQRPPCSEFTEKHRSQAALRLQQAWRPSVGTSWVLAVPISGLTCPESQRSPGQSSSPTRPRCRQTTRSVAETGCLGTRCQAKKEGITRLAVLFKTGCLPSPFPNR